LPSRADTTLRTLFVPASMGATPTGLEKWSPVSPSRIVSGDDWLSQVPREPPCPHALLFDPGGVRASPRSWAALRCCLPQFQKRRLPQDVKFRGSITRPTGSLSTLRGLEALSKPRKTRFRLVA